MTTTKPTLTDADIRCIFPGYLGCPNCHCVDCSVFLIERCQTPVQHYYRFWFAYLQVNGLLPKGISKRRLQSKSKAMDAKEKNSRVWRKKMSKSEAKKLDWQQGKYDKVRGKHPNKFGG